MTRFRPFRNTDPPSLVRLWNQGAPASASVRPLCVHELDERAFGSVLFDSAGLIVAERDGRIVGFAHAGFGPALPIAEGRPFELDYELGTIAMLLVGPEDEDEARERELVDGLIDAAGHYLRGRGARVLYAGAQFPLNPFYWGIGGGSEGAGVLSGHEAFHRGLARRGYVPVSAVVLLELDLARPETRDPRAVLVRRQTQLELLDDEPPPNWWQALALGAAPVGRARLLARANAAELARASIWDMQGFERADGHSRLGLINLEVPLEHRRKGYARHLVSEIVHGARANGVERIAVQTSAENEPALALYAALGFEPVDQATLYRATT